LQLKTDQNINNLKAAATAAVRLYYSVTTRLKNL
jgi:hypothetical protein